MAEFRNHYRTYRFVDKNPVIDKVRTLLEDEGLMTDLNAAHEISGVGTATLRAWFFGDTKNPFHSTVAALTSSLGYEETFVRVNKINIKAERELGKQWLVDRAKRKAKASAKANGKQKPKKKKATT
jgi:hypothetical protein